MNNCSTLKVFKALFLTILVPGVLLTGFMAHTESEPGALPLLLILTGVVGVVVTRIRSRRTAVKDRS